MKYSNDDINRVVDISTHQPIKATQIAEHLGFSTENNQVETRGLITEAISAGNLIISNTYYGYSIAKNRDEVITYIRSIDSRIENLKSRKGNILNAWKKSHGTDF